LPCVILNWAQQKTGRSANLEGFVGAFLLIMSKKLTNEDFCRAAKRLKCGVANIKTVDDVESKGSGFYPDGFPTILFERHKFHKYSKGKFSKDYPEISNPNAGGYGKAGANQRRKFNLAFSLDPKAAMLSCSWGRYQIMGFNYAVCGFVSVGDFVDAMKESEGAQLLAFCEFVEENNLADELRNREWAEFARGYNGKNYKINSYDTKLAAAYKQFSKENIDCSKVSTDKPIKPAEAISSSPKEIPAETSNNSVDAPAEIPAQNIEQTADNIINQSADTDAAKVEAAANQPPTEIPKTKPSGFGTKIIAFFTAIFSGEYLVPQFVQDGAANNQGVIVNFIGSLLRAAYENRYLIIGVLVVWYVTKKINQAWLTGKIADINTDQTRGNIVLVEPEKKKGLFQKGKEFFFGA
jgi:hypothetical protein